MSFRKHFRELAELLKAKGEEDLISSVEDTIRLCGQYVLKVNQMECAFITANLTMDTMDYRVYINELNFPTSKFNTSIVY